MILGAVLFHLGIAIIMGLFWFSLTMLSADAIFITDDMYKDFWKLSSTTVQNGWIRISNKLRRSKEPSNFHSLIKKQVLLVIYDDACPVCNTDVKKWTLLDTLRLLRFCSLWTFPVEEYSLTREDVIQRMHVISLEKGKIYSGCRALVHIMSRIPVLLPVSGLLSLLIIMGVGEPLYNFLAKSRYLIPIGKCSTESCLYDVRKAEETK